MNAIDLIMGRRSVREYLPNGVSEESIALLIHAAVHAPSAVNEQPWAFSVIRDQELLTRVSDASKQYALAEAHGGAAEHLRPMLSDPKFHIFYHAPVLILISAVGDSGWIAEDCALAAQNLMLMAYAERLGSCWIGFAQRYLRTPEGKAMIGLSAEECPVAPIIVGWPKAQPVAPSRNAPRVRWL